MRGAGLGGGGCGKISSTKTGLSNLLRELSSRDQKHCPSVILASGTTSSSGSTSRRSRRVHQKRRQEQYVPVTSAMSPGSLRLSTPISSPDSSRTDHSSSLSEASLPGAAWKHAKRITQRNAADLRGIHLSDTSDEGISKGRGGAAKGPVVQALYDACREAFGGSGGGAASEARVQSILDSMTPADVGLEDFTSPPAPNKRRNPWPFAHRPATPPSSPPSPSPITYLDLHECDKFSICIFCLPPHARLPLHNHPGMTVLSRVLAGSIHVRSYDWVDMEEELSSGPRAARLVEDQILTSASETEILYPTMGNIHEFSAMSSPCVVLDVLAPPYNMEAGRVCSYFRETSRRPVRGAGSRPSLAPSSSAAVPEDSQSSSSSSTNSAGTSGNSVDEEVTVWLQECLAPQDFVTRRGSYRGPAIHTD